MPSRRDVVKTAIGISALPLIGGRFASGAVAPGDSWLRDALVDERNAASRAFGSAARTHGLSVHESRGDWSQLWFTRLAREWHVQPAAIAGVTYHGPLFTFEQLARPRGMRLVFVAELRRYSNGAASLRVSGPTAAAVRAEQAVGLDDETWGASMGEILVGLSANSWRPPAGRAEVTNGIEAPLSTEHPDPIYAWLIAPTARAPRFV
jgi:hypothetical protein